MTCHIKPMDEMTLLVKKRRFASDCAPGSVPAFWDEYWTPLPPVEGRMGICHDEADGSFTYMIGDFCAPDATAPQGFEKLTIPAYTWAVFEGRGVMTHAMQELTHRVFTEWVPTNGQYELAAGWDVEYYFCGDMDSEAYCFELWIPVVPKNA